MVCSLCFSGSLGKGLFLVFFRFCMVLRVPREVIFDTFLDKIAVFCEKAGPSIAFWLDFEGPGLLRESKKRENSYGQLTFF